MIVFLAGCGGDGGERRSGVPWELARERARLISDVRYGVFFSFTPGKDVSGRVTCSFELDAVQRDLTLDFAGIRVDSVVSGGAPIPYVFEDEHIVIAREELSAGRNSFEITFVPDEGPLHREDRFLYTLFVPDRARFAFPCFDQPDLKARFELTLEIPSEWTAVSNTPVAEESTGDGRKRIRFEPTQHLSTYLFSFAAGAFNVESGTAAGRTIDIYHLEEDTAKVGRSIGEILRWHGTALEFLEEYTGIAYPFDKFDVVLIPAFTYRGMEHPGAVLYRAEKLLLEESATLMDLVGRAGVICHETAHMWFGDLVTMTWFDDVWLKEAFAQFMADKCLESFEIDQQLLFFSQHYGPLYEVERTVGTHPIRQRLENLDQAGMLYGNIIYHKPPIMLRQLESLMGEAVLREGLRHYLERYSFGNARWEDLVELLDPLTMIDLEAWSTVWVMEAGRPTVSFEVAAGERPAFERLLIRQEDPAGSGRVWPQRFHIAVRQGDIVNIAPVTTDTDLSELSVSARIEFLFPDWYGEGFGYFTFAQPELLTELHRSLDGVTGPLQRGVYYLFLRENMLGGEIDDRLGYLRRLLSSLERESEGLNIQALLDYIVEAYWSFVTEAERRQVAGMVEDIIRNKIPLVPDTSTKSACFKAFLKIVSTDKGAYYLWEIWKGEREIAGISFSERDFASMSLELAVRGARGWPEILTAQEGRFTDAAELERFRFIMPAATPEKGERDRFFALLADVENRRKEPWVLDALYFLHHPWLREESAAYIPVSLELTEEIQRTGDIFFPRNWLVATLRYHTSDEAAAAVRSFLEERQGYPKYLRLMVLQAADRLFRANRMLSAGAGES